MPTLYQIVIGGTAVVLGLAWIADPLRMRRYQSRFQIFGADENDITPTRTRLVAGRVGGLVLAALGVAFLLGVIP